MSRLVASETSKVWKEVPSEMAERLIVLGTPQECVEKINSFVAQGVAYPVICPCMTKEDFPYNVNRTIPLLAPYLA